MTNIFVTKLPRDNDIMLYSMMVWALFMTIKSVIDFMINTFFVTTFIMFFFFRDKNSFNTHLM
jgi:hypothetical protein